MLTLLFACAPPPPTPENVVPTPALVALENQALGSGALELVAASPLWLRHQLAWTLAQQDTETQEHLAEVILTADPLWMDEILFSLANTSPETVKTKKFHPEMLVENARMIYEVDPYLSYVELVEEGEGEDWWTTTRYQVERDGVVQELTLDRDTYYWYVVHPRIEDEHPWMIDAWEECNSATLECGQKDPTVGDFWRHFLWEGAAETCPEGDWCPVLKDTMTEATILTNGKQGGDSAGAVREIVEFMLSSDPEKGRWLNFGAYDERSIQPNRIYALGRGNCGEWADMTTALSRTALIPNVNVSPSSWDHTWSAFHDGTSWVPWEPVNFMIGGFYGLSYVVRAQRGDTTMWYQSADYSENTFTAVVTVTDAEGLPVDGASVATWTPSGDDWWYAGELITGADGTAEFEVGAGGKYIFYADSPLGDTGGSKQLDASAIVAGGREAVSLTVEGSRSAATPITVVGSEGEWAVSGSVEALEGRIVGTSLAFDERGFRPSAGPELEVWILDEAGMAALEAGEAVEALDEGAAQVPAGEPAYVVVRNVGGLAQVAHGTLRVQAQDQSADLPFQLDPGGWAAVRVE